jgi:ABC-type transport system involved in cytochrome bd biosynthesis fused ATPase/permease subunit
MGVAVAGLLALVDINQRAALIKAELRENLKLAKRANASISALELIAGPPRAR